jgi:stress response protein YsnF
MCCMARKQPGNAYFFFWEDREGMWERIKAFFGADVPEEDTSYYAEGVSRNGVVVAVDVPDEIADRVAEVMDEHGAVDIDKRASEWKESGWLERAAKQRDYSGEQAPSGQKTAIPVAEEDVKIGKHVFSKGSVRVYSRITETPVEEDVRLREEYVTVERRAVDRPASEGAFQETSIEVEETAEEPVISRQARVKER